MGALMARRVRTGARLSQSSARRQLPPTSLSHCRSLRLGPLAGSGSVGHLASAVAHSHAHPLPVQSKPRSALEWRNSFALGAGAGAFCPPETPIVSRRASSPVRRVCLAPRSGLSGGRRAGGRACACAARWPRTEPHGAPCGHNDKFAPDRRPATRRKQGHESTRGSSAGLTNSTPMAAHRGRRGPAGPSGHLTSTRRANGAAPEARSESHWRPARRNDPPARSDPIPPDPMRAGSMRALGQINHALGAVFVFATGRAGRVEPLHHYSCGFSLWRPARCVRSPFCRPE